MINNLITYFATVLKQWTRWGNSSTNSKIFGATIVIASLTFIAKLVSMAKEIAVAGSFGTGDAIDAFLIAFLVPSFAINVIGGSFNAALIPTYLMVREKEGAVAAQNLFASSMVLSLILLLAAAILMIFAAPIYLPLLASGFSSEKIALTCQLLYLLSPIVVIYGLNMIWGAVLNADKRFGLVAIAPVVTPLIILLFLLLGCKTWGINALAFGAVCGMTFEVLLLARALKLKGISLCPKWHGMDSNLRQVIKQYAPMIAGAFLLSGTDLINQSMAAMLEPGSVSALNYGNRIISVPINLAATALGTAVIPYFSTMVAQLDWSGVRHTLKQYYRLIFFTTVPATLILILVSEPLVRLFYQRGSFTAEDTILVSQIQIFYALQIPFYVAGILTGRMISALRANYILMIGNGISLMLCVLFNYYFINILGVAGIALSASCNILITFIFLYFCLKRLSGALNE